jgi:anti-sigma factor RsiW
LTLPCSDPRLEGLLTRYELGLLEPEVAREVEVHLLTCDSCFARVVQDSEVLARLLGELEGQGEQPPRTLPSANGARD